MRLLLFTIVAITLIGGVITFAMTRVLPNELANTITSGVYFDHSSSLESQLANVANGQAQLACEKAGGTYTTVKKTEFMLDLGVCNYAPGSGSLVSQTQVVSILSSVAL